MRRLIIAVVLTTATALCLAAGAFGDGPPPAAQRILGQVPALTKASNFATAVSGLGKLSYHGGPIMPTNKVYAIYWIPAGYSVSPGYTSTINRYFGDVATDSGRTSNVYYSTTQYYQGSNPKTYIQYSSTFAGSVVDTAAFPASGCTDTVTQTSVCLSDAQLQAEITRIKNAQGWVSNGTTEFFLFTPQNVGSCYDSANCAFSQYCAYHSSYGSGSTVTLYANQPYTMTVPSGCDSTQHPNGDAADPTINVVSHEHAETITDPLGNAWYDLAGYENGDKCAWNFGTATGSTAYGQYNQTINGHFYYVQQEYSNARSNCVLTGT
ncbi:MAG: hypothetical protein QOG29_1956 [Gaiellaceae bacterium]|jgi:hypothetical protein|nr:hypothetical protein [Gaiellaceae bacterium]MDX6479369.1 hypothetical protein [Gaiellaceae bacterium]